MSVMMREMDNQATTPFDHCPNGLCPCSATLHECQTKQMTKRS